MEKYAARGPFCPSCGGRLRRQTVDPRPHGLTHERLRCTDCRKQWHLDSELTEITREVK